MRSKDRDAACLAELQQWERVEEEGGAGRVCPQGPKGFSALWPRHSSSHPGVGPTCGGHPSEVVCPAEHHSGPVAGTLNQRPGQGREEEDHGQVQHGHKEREVEALWTQSRQQGWREATQPLCFLTVTTSALYEGVSHTATPWNKGCEGHREVAAQGLNPCLVSSPPPLLTTFSPPGTNVQEKAP